MGYIVIYPLPHKPTVVDLIDQSSLRSLLWRFMIYLTKISIYTLYRAQDRLTYMFPNFNGATVAVWERKSNFTPSFTGYVIIPSVVPSDLVMVIDRTHQDTGPGSHMPNLIHDENYEVLARNYAWRLGLALHSLDVHIDNSVKICRHYEQKFRLDWITKSM